MRGCRENLTWVRLGPTFEIAIEPAAPGVRLVVGAIDNLRHLDRA
jgi:hypothetical protein